MGVHAAAAAPPPGLERLCDTAPPCGGVALKMPKPSLDDQLAGSLLLAQVPHGSTTGDVGVQCHGGEITAANRSWRADNLPRGAG